MGVELMNVQATTLRGRLIEAADIELATYGSLTGRFEAVAHRAGVSRATAYRQIGSVSELLKQVGLRRSQKYVACLREVMEAEDGVLAKLEAAMVYGARVLPDDPIVLDLISREFSRALDPEVHGLVNTLLGPVLAAGRRSGEIRSDVHLDLVIHHLVEQSYLATCALDRSAEAVRQRFRTFIEPAISPRGGT
jgi:AcrR family transcriptional regulator